MSASEESTGAPEGPLRGARRLRPELAVSGWSAVGQHIGKADVGRGIVCVSRRMLIWRVADMQQSRRCRLRWRH